MCCVVRADSSTPRFAIGIYEFINIIIMHKFTYIYLPVYNNLEYFITLCLI